MVFNNNVKISKLTMTQNKHNTVTFHVNNLFNPFDHLIFVLLIRKKRPYDRYFFLPIFP